MLRFTDSSAHIENERTRAWPAEMIQIFQRYIDHDYNIYNLMLQKEQIYAVFTMKLNTEMHSKFYCASTTVLRSMSIGKTLALSEIAAASS